MRPSVSPCSKELLQNVLRAAGRRPTYKRAKHILEDAITKIPAGRSRQVLQDALPQLKAALKRLIREQGERPLAQEKKSSWACQNGFIAAVKEASDAASMLVQCRLPAHRQLLQTITSGVSVQESIRACSRLCGASAVPDISSVVLHVCQLADSVLKPAAASLLGASGSCHDRVDQSQAAVGGISELIHAINELVAISGLRAAAHSNEPVELLRNSGHGLACSVQGRLLFTLAAAHVCDSLLDGGHTQWVSSTFLDIHAKVVGELQRFCVSVRTSDVEQFLLGHAVLDIESLEVAPWAAVPMCAWLAVRTAVRPPVQCRALPLQVVLLHRAEMHMHSIAGDMAGCARETALIRDKPCSRDAVAWIKSLPAGTMLPACWSAHDPAESSLAALLLEHPAWPEVQALNKLYLGSLQQDPRAAAQQAHDQSLFVLDAAADTAVAEWNASKEASDQDTDSVDGTV